MITKNKFCVLIFLAIFSNCISNADSKNSSFPKKGEIYFADLTQGAIGSEIIKKRPVVIISADSINKSSSRVTIAPITSKKTSKILAFEVPITIKNKQKKERPGKVLLDQIRAIDKSRLEGFAIDTCDANTIKKIDKALVFTFVLLKNAKIKTK